MRQMDAGFLRRLRQFATSEMVFRHFQYLGLALKADKPLRIMGQRSRKNLDRYITIELGVASAVNLAHAARTDGGEDLVRAQFVANRQGHELE